jgi:hypothetical protein
MSFENLIKSATAMGERLTKARTSGDTDNPTERVSKEELDAFEQGVRNAIHTQWGAGTTEDREWSAVLSAKDKFIRNAIAQDTGDGLGSYAGYIDYFNLAVTTLNKFEAALKSRPTTPLGHAHAVVRRLPPWLRGPLLALVLIVSSAVALWNFLPGELRDSVVTRAKAQAPVVTITALIPARTETVERPFNIDETNAKHDLADSNIRSYNKRFNADLGFKITAANLEKRSDNNVQNLVTNVDQGGQSVVVTFGLKAGPKTDRYRGWLRATLKTVQERTVPGSTVDVVRSWPAVKGTSYATTVAEAPRVERVEVRDDKGTLVATGALGESLKIADLSLSVSAQGATMTVKAE